MPTPNEGESQKDFVSRCIPIVLEDGTAEDNDQAVAVCNSMWEQDQEETTEQEPGGPDVCACPDCDYEADKERGTPCRSMECPECGAALVAKVESEEVMKPGEIARQAIETARAVCNDSVMLAKLAEAKGKSTQQVANRMLDELAQELEKSTKVVEADTDMGKLRSLLAQALKMLPEESSEEEPPAEESDALQNVGLALESHDATDEDTANLTEAEAATVETGRRAPVIVDFQMITPGPGNKKDNHYYPADVLKRDIGVFGEADVFATDHKAEQRSELTKVGKVLKVPIRFTEDQAPVARVLIYDPAQAEKARNRADADALSTLECSIYGSGRAKSRKIDGIEYKVVEAITEGKYLELVSKAGAGGHALNLAENDGGETMGNEDETRETEGDEETTQEVDLAEGEQQGTQEETTEEAESLAEAEVESVLAEIRLPDKVKALLAAQSYADKAALDSAIAEMVEEFKEATGSGRPTVRRSSVRKPKPKETLAEVGKAQDAVNAKFLRTRTIQEDAK